MISKEKWTEIKLSWARYRNEYLFTIASCIVLLLGIWVLAIKPAIDEGHNETLVELKTKLLQNIKDNSHHKNFKRTDTMQSDIYIDK